MVTYFFTILYMNPWFQDMISPIDAQINQIYWLFQEIKNAENGRALVQLACEVKKLESMTNDFL